MTKSPALNLIEKAIGELSCEERLWLIERLAHSLRPTSTEAKPGLAEALAAMAADPDIRRELEQLARDFSGTEMDGLGQL